MEVSFTGRSSQIGEYFQGDYNFCSYDLFNSSTWTPLVNSDVVFLLLPKHKDTLDGTKKLILRLMDSSVKHIIKIGSLGPWRLIHNQIDTFIKESGIAYTSFDIAPLMNNIFTEQYIAEHHTLLDYRGGSPAPYLDPRCLASAIEQSVDNDNHKNRNYRCTGNTQYTISQVKDILNSTGFTVDKVETTSNQVLHDLKDTNDQLLMTKISERYTTEGWFPPVSNDLKENFNTNARTLEKFISEDRHIFSKQFLDDKSL